MELHALNALGWAKMAYYFKGLRQSAIDTLGQKVCFAVVRGSADSPALPASIGSAGFTFLSMKWAHFIAAKRGKPCRDVTKGQDCDGLPSAEPTTSPGQSAAAAASAQRVRQTANKLKWSSQNGCSTEDAERAQVSRCDPHNRRVERVPVQEKT